MTDQKNLLLALVLSMTILGLYQYFVERPRMEAARLQQQQAATAGSTDTALPPENSLQPALPVTMPRAQALGESARVRIDTPELSGSIALNGARLDDIALKNYAQTLADKKAVVVFSPGGSERAYYADVGWLGNDVPDSETPWTVQGNDVLSPGKPVLLSWTNPAGVEYQLQYAVDANYLLTVTRRVRNGSAEPLTLYPYAALSRRGLPEEEDAKQSGASFEGALGAFDGTLEEISYKKLQKKNTVSFSSTGGWAGLSDHYWLSALIPTAQQLGHQYSMRTARRGDEPVFQVDYREQGDVIQPGQESTSTMNLFVGAKELEVIDRYSKTLGVPLFDRTINFGWFYFLTRPMLALLHHLYLWVGNFGVAIVLLTILVRIVLAPLAHKSYVSINRMKDLQPRVNDIRERNSDDRMKMNQEIMKLYQQEKVNPMAGCLPVLLQIPVFFALYKVLLVSIEMRHAPFFGWIRDLAAPDPTSLFNLFGLLPYEVPEMLHIGVWPCLVGLTMYMSQKMNPPPPDPTQAMILKLFPFVFTYITALFPAGLAVYWTFNNLFSVLQQYSIKKIVDRRKPVPLALK